MPEGEVDKTKFEPMDITLEEYESIRLSDYHKIKQKVAADIMGISQPTFHRILNSAREKVANGLVEGKIINIRGGDYVIDKNRYRCVSCGFEWQNLTKDYKKCPDCKSEDIIKEGLEVGQPGLARRKSFGGPGIGGGPPRICKCPECGYEGEKVRAVPCRTSNCPECGTPLCGAD
jgi:predicted DNA-binding protein (UPF0251 family)